MSVAFRIIQLGNLALQYSLELPKLAHNARAQPWRSHAFEHAGKFLSFLTSAPAGAGIPTRPNRDVSRCSDLPLTGIAKSSDHADLPIVIRKSVRMGRPAWEVIPGRIELVVPLSIGR